MARQVRSIASNSGLDLEVRNCCPSLIPTNVTNTGLARLEQVEKEMLGIAGRHLVEEGPAKDAARWGMSADNDFTRRQERTKRYPEDIIEFFTYGSPFIRAVLRIAPRTSPEILPSNKTPKSNESTVSQEVATLNQPLLKSKETEQIKTPRTCNCPPKSHGRQKPKSQGTSKAQKKRSGAAKEKRTAKQNSAGSDSDVASDIDNDVAVGRSTTTAPANKEQETTASTCGRCHNYKKPPRGKKLAFRERTKKWMFVPQDAPDGEDPNADQDDEELPLVQDSSSLMVPPPDQTAKPGNYSFLDRGARHRRGGPGSRRDGD